LKIKANSQLRTGSEARRFRAANVNERLPNISAALRAHVRYPQRQNRSSILNAAMAGPATVRAQQPNYQRMVEVLSLALGAGYLAALPAYPYAGSSIIKGLSIAVLAMLPWLSRPVTNRRDAGLLSAALVASSMGDVFLDVGPERLFVPGLGAFLAAHIIYTVLFLKSPSRSTSKGLSRRFGPVGVAVYAIAFALWLAPSLGPLKIPVALYIGAITAMVISAVRSRFGWRVASGALLFLVSDSLLAIAKFKTPFAGRDYLVWATYYAAQYLIATGALRGFQNRINYAVP
jgi:uncharacterized membrane protein YhhN